MLVLCYVVIVSESEGVFGLWCLGVVGTEGLGDARGCSSLRMRLGGGRRPAGSPKTTTTTTTTRRERRRCCPRRQAEQEGSTVSCRCRRCYCRCCYCRCCCCRCRCRCRRRGWGTCGRRRPGSTGRFCGGSAGPWCCWFVIFVFRGDGSECGVVIQYLIDARS